MEALTCNFCNRKMLFFKIEDGTVEVMCKQSDCKRINKLVCRHGVCLQILSRPLVDNSGQYKKNVV